MLYAIWEELHYDITYNANGGFLNDGSTSIVKKKYKSFSAYIINLKPTRENYEFKGWSTTLNGEVKYVENDVYSANQNLTLYAVWEKISNIKIVELYRCDIDGNKISDGTYARLQFEYTATNNTLVSGTSTLEWKRTSESNYTDSVVMTHAPCDKGKTITIDTIFGNGNLSNEESYAVLITMNESGVTYTKEITLSANRVFVDFKPPTDIGTGGMAIGKSAQFDGVLDIGYQTMFSGGILYSTLALGKDFNTLITPNIYSLIKGGSNNKYTNCPISTDGTLSVEPVGASGDVRQVVTGNSANPIRYERYYTASKTTWTDWVVTYDPGVGKFVYASESTSTIATADTYVSGATVTIPSDGLYLITGRAIFGTSTTSKSVTVAIQDVSNNKLVEAQFSAALKNEATRVTVSQFYNCTSGMILQCRKKSSVADVDTKYGGTYIVAVRIA